MKTERTRCVCETQMPMIMANSKDGQDHKDKYFDTSRKSCHKKNDCVQYGSSNILSIKIVIV